MLFRSDGLVDPGQEFLELGGAVAAVQLADHGAVGDAEGGEQAGDAVPGVVVGAPQETLDILGDQDAVADLRQSREDFASGDTYTAAQVRAELEQRRRLGSQ